MSMNTSGASGYVVKASEFTRLLPGKVQAQYLNAIAEQDIELVEELLGENVPDEFPTFESAFVLQDECAGDAPELEVGEVYICFQDDDLYIRTPTPGLELFKEQGIDPQFQRWTTFG